MRFPLARAASIAVERVQRKAEKRGATESRSSRKRRRCLHVKGAFSRCHLKDKRIINAVYVNGNDIIPPILQSASPHSIAWRPSCIVFDPCRSQACSPSRWVLLPNLGSGRRLDVLMKRLLTESGILRGGQRRTQGHMYPDEGWPGSHVFAVPGGALRTAT